MPQDRMKIFKLYQHREEVVLGEGEDAVTVFMWKPTNEQASQGQLFLLERMDHWQTSGEKLADSVVSAIKRMSKEELIEQIILQTAAHKVAENRDLIPDQARAELERDLLRGFEPGFLEEHFGLKPGGESALAMAKQKEDFNRDHVLSLIRKADQFEELLDLRLQDVVTEKFKESEAGQYEVAQREDLETTLEQINTRTVAYGMALREWTQRMVAHLTRYPHEVDPSRKGEQVFSLMDSDDNYVGNVSEEVFQILTEAVGKLMNLGRADEVRAMAEDANFQESATLPKTSDSLPPDAPEPPTLQTTPST